MTGKNIVGHIAMDFRIIVVVGCYLLVCSHKRLAVLWNNAIAVLAKCDDLCFFTCFVGIVISYSTWVLTGRYINTWVT